MMRLWLVAAAVLAALAIGWRYGAASVQAKWDAERVQQLEQQREMEHEARRIENARATVAAAAANAARERDAALLRDAERARAESERLRDDASAYAAGVPEEPAASCAERAAALAELLADVERAGAGMAQAADRHANDARTLIEAWPR